MNSDHAYIHQEWHRAASTRDTLALIALYADDAILESPLVPALMDGKSDGVLRGKGEIGRFFAAGARSRPIDLVRWYRSDTYFSAGGTLIWEYPRVTPEACLPYPVDLPSTMRRGAPTRQSSPISISGSVSRKLSVERAEL